MTSALLALLVVACKSGAKTDQPVVTRERGGSSTSPSGTAAAAEGKSMVRLVNAVPGQHIDVTGDEQPVFNGVAYKDVSPYVEVKDNVIKFRAKTTGGDRVLAENTETLADGFRYTIVVMPGEHGDLAMRILKDEVIPDAGKARLRVINAAADLDNVDVAVAGRRDALFSGVAPGHEAGPTDLDPMTVSLDFRSNRATSPVRVRNMSLAAGRSYTVVLAGPRGRVETITFDDAVALSRLSHQ